MCKRLDAASVTQVSLPAPSVVANEPKPLVSADTSKPLADRLAAIR
jgi:hypothetical protein